jgi:hypothetical protein
LSKARSLAASTCTTLASIKPALVSSPLQVILGGALVYLAGILIGIFVTGNGTLPFRTVFDLLLN